MIYGLIGYPLSHSFSKEFFTHKFRDENIPNCKYLNFPVQDLKEFPGLINHNQDLQGLNVTIPYKEKIIPFLDELDKDALEVGAVNTIKFSRKNNITLLKGYNTDIYGFRRSLDEILSLRKDPLKSSLILGSGGASRAVAWVFTKMNIPFEIISSRPGIYRNYKDLTVDDIRKVDLIVNTTPLGMYPDVNGCPPLPYQYLTNSHILFDLIYNPSRTLFLKKGYEKGAVICNGLKMLEYQALKSWEIWNKK